MCSLKVKKSSEEYRDGHEWLNPGKIPEWVYERT